MDVSMLIFKKDVISAAISKFPDTDFSDLFENYLYQWIPCDLCEDSGIPKDELCRYLFDTEARKVREFFIKHLGREPKDSEAILVDEITFKEFLCWIEREMKSTTLYDVAISNDIEASVSNSMDIVYAFNSIQNTSIDFNSEVIIYRESW